MRRYLITVIAAAFSIFVISADLKSGNEVSWLDCVSTAKDKRSELMSAMEKIKQMQDSVKIARSGYLPQIEADAGVSRQKNSYNNSSGRASSVTNNNYTYGLTGKQLLFDGLKISDEMKALEKQADSLRYEYKVTSSNIRLDLRTAYVQLMKAQEAIKLTKDILKIRKQNLELVKMRHNAGREHKGSLLTAQANLAQAENEFSQAMRYLSLAQKSLNREMGISDNRNIAVTVNFSLNYDKQEPDFTALSLSNPLLQKIIQLKESGEYNVKSAKADHYPRVFATGNINKSDTKFPPEGTNWSIGAQMTLPLFQGGSTYYGVSKAEAELRQLNADVKTTRDSVLLTMQQKWNNLQNGIDSISVQAKFLKAAEERAKIAEAQYSIGVIVFDNWTIIQDNYVATKKTYLDTIANVLLAEAEWIQAKGETLDYDR
jgi:outer membrane protein TolC